MKTIIHVDQRKALSRVEVFHEPAVTSLPPVVLSTALDLVDLSEPALCSDGAGSSIKDQRRSPLRRKDSRSPRRRTRPDETELIQVEVEHLPASPRTPERTSLDSGAAD